MKKFFHNLFGIGKKQEYSFEETLDRVSENLSTMSEFVPCKKCCGLFTLGSLKTVAEITVVPQSNGSILCFKSIEAYCDRCKPPSDLTLNLMDAKNKTVIDYKHFIFNEFAIAEIFDEVDF